MAIDTMGEAMLRALNGQVALVTGAGNGIGAAVVEALATLGATVVGWDRSLRALAPVPNGKVTLVELDVTNADAVEEAATLLLQQHGRLDILVNNAGISGAAAPLIRYDDAEWDRVIDVNLKASFRLCKRFVPQMVERRYGRVINMASTAACRGMATGAAYASSKAGLVAMSMTLAKEVAPSGVTVNCVAPGPIETDLLKDMGASFVADVVSKIAMQRLGRPDEVAAMVGWIASPACSFTAGAVFDISGGRILN